MQDTASTPGLSRVFPYIITEFCGAYTIRWKANLLLSNAFLAFRVLSWHLDAPKRSGDTCVCVCVCVWAVSKDVKLVSSHIILQGATGEVYSQWPMKTLYTSCVNVPALVLTVDLRFC